jgi:hypothetical protein
MEHITAEFGIREPVVGAKSGHETVGQDGQQNHRQRIPAHPNFSGILSCAAALRYQLRSQESRPLVRRLRICAGRLFLLDLVSLQWS